MRIPPVLFAIYVCREGKLGDSGGRRDDGTFIQQLLFYVKAEKCYNGWKMSKNIV
jgi:hypothetical protein